MLLPRISVIAYLFYTVHEVSALECYCEGDGCSQIHANETCVVPDEGKCFAAAAEQQHELTGDWMTVYTFGCLSVDETALLQCKANLAPQVRRRFHILCCGNESFCNQDLQPELPPRLTTTSASPVPFSSLPDVDWRYVGPAVGVIAAAICIIVIVFCCFPKCCHRRDKNAQLSENQALMPNWGVFGRDVEKGCAEHSLSSGSGSGCPRLVQTSVARQLQLNEIVGKGRYGEVWRARFRDADVAVKIFSSLDMDSWQSEKDLYETGLLRHENILGYVVSDIGGTGAETQMLLVTDYHRASLYDYLREIHVPLSIPVIYNMAHSIASGLSYLHGDIVGNTSSKPVIAHRDLKTKNILVKHDGVTCVIADLGLAVRKDRSEDLVASTDKRQGTRRYMAPEILSRTIRKYVFESYLQADMYSLGLVLWEIARCQSKGGIQGNYRLPYQEEVGDDPDFETMEKWVCLENQRPRIEPHWAQNDSMNVLRQLMEECWSECPTARLSALNVKKKLAKNTPADH